MPRLPTTISEGQRQPVLSPDTQVRGYDTRAQNSIGANDAQDFANAGAALQGIADPLKQKDDKDSILDAQSRINNAQKQATDYLYAPETGILNQKGGNAIGATQKAKEYLANLRASTTEGITNPMAQRAIYKDFDQLSNGLMETTERHESQQTADYSGALAQDHFDNARNIVGLQYNDDKVFSASMDTAEKSIAAQGKIDGLPTENRLLAAKSSLWETRITAAAESTDPATIALAGKYYEQAKSANELTAVANQNLATKLKTVVPDAQSQQFFNQHRNDLLTSTMSPDQLYTSGQVGDPGDSLVKAVAQQESGGKDYNKDGSLVTSDKGAQGMMQVMPGTNADPGFGVTAARDDSPEERNRVGRDYLAAMVKRYGDNRLALAAYNAGPGTVDDAIAKHGKENVADVLADLPAETQNYVPKVLASAANVQIDGGQGYDQTTLKAAADKLPEEQRPYFLAKAKADHDSIVQTWNNNRLGAIDAVQVALQNADGNISAVPAQARADAIKYGVWPVLSQTLGKSDPAMTNTLSGMSTDQLIATDFNDPNVRMRLSAKDIQEWQKKQSDIVTNPTNQAMQRSIDSGLRYAFQMDQIINPVTGVPVTDDQLDALKRRTDNPNAFIADDSGEGTGTTSGGAIGSPDKNNAALYDKFLRVKQIVTQRVIADYQAGNKTAGTPASVRNIIDETLIDQATNKERQVIVGSITDRHLFAKSTTRPDVRAITDLRTNDIPEATRKNIESFLTSRGLPVDEAHVLDVYTKTLIHHSKVGPYAADQRKQDDSNG